MIFISKQELQDIIHDAIGDTPRVEVVLNGRGADTEWEFEPIRYGEGDAVDVGDLPGLEKRIMNAVMEHDDPTF